MIIDIGVTVINIKIIVTSSGTENEIVRSIIVPEYYQFENSLPKSVKLNKRELTFLWERFTNQ